MRMNWNAENVARLVALIMREADVRLSKDMLERIAADMGPDCTAKAITHQITKMKTASPTDTNSAADASPSRAATKHKQGSQDRTETATSAVKIAGKKRGRPPKNNKPATVNGDRGETSEDMVDSEPELKRIKGEEVENQTV